MPTTPFIGVRISWLMLARKSDLARTACSAVCIACRGPQRHAQLQGSLGNLILEVALAAAQHQRPTLHEREYAKRGDQGTGSPDPQPARATEQQASDVARTQRIRATEIGINPFDGTSGQIQSVQTAARADAQLTGCANCQGGRASIGQPIFVEMFDRSRGGTLRCDGQLKLSAGPTEFERLL